MRELPTSKYSKTGVFESDYYCCCCYCVCLWCVSGYIHVTVYVWRSEDNFVIDDSLLFPLHGFLIPYCGHQASVTATLYAEPSRLFKKTQISLFLCNMFHRSFLENYLMNKVMIYIPQYFLWKYSGVSRTHLHIQKTVERDPCVMCRLTRVCLFVV